MEGSLGWFWSLLWTLGVLVLPPQRAVGFLPNFWSRAMAFAWGSVTHQDMTEDAILNVTLRLFVELRGPRDGRIKEEDFKGRTLVADEVFAAFFGHEVSARRFRAAIAEVSNANAGMDFEGSTRDDPVLHFDSELVGPANAWLLRARKEVLQAVRKEEYGLARRRLGQLLHSLQDFYSHSNWVELGRREIHPRLLQPGREIKSLAEADVPTCTDCTDQTCRGNILDGVQAKGLLTTGYYGSNPDKPPGKCSHGGRFDSSQSREPRGGINKDSNSLFFSPHHYLHGEAAALGLEASVHFLDKLHRELGRKQFMRLLDISPATGLSFVIDTTGSMGEEIKAARRQAWEIIQRRRGTPQEPDQYLLVPFHDPDFGPAYKTSNSEEFLQHLNSISPLAGGDEPEMCLSALQLALLNSPPLSEIFVFTDASAKDRHLKNSVKALIEERRCKVTFLITEDPSRTRVRREILAPDRFDLYVSLALHSGGQVIFTDNNNIWSAAEVIGESAATSVTLFHHQEGGSFVPGESWRRTKRQSRTWRRHQFWIDSLVENVVISVQGDVTNFYIRDPNGKTQLSTLLPRALATIRSVGTFHRAFLLPPLTVGNWALELLAGTNYSANVQGQSAFDFLYYFAVPFEGPHPGLFKLDSRPVEGLPTFLVVVATGLQPPEGGAVRVHGVGLADRAGGKPVAELQLEEGANRTDTFVALLPPALAAGSSFSVILRGTDSHGRKVERNGQQVNTVVGCLMELSSEAPLFPGRPGYVLWKVTNAGSAKKYDLRVSIEPRMPVNISSSWLQLGRNQTASGQISLGIPDDASPGTAVTVTLRGDPLNPSKEPNFAFITLLVMSPALVPKPSFPPCNVTWVEGACGPLESACHDGRWAATLRIWDEAGVWLVVTAGGAVVPHRADGAAELVAFSSDCCSQEVELLVTNRLREEYRCHVSAPIGAPPAAHVEESAVSAAPSWGTMGAAYMVASKLILWS